jgi:hypothetical protein
MKNGLLPGLLALSLLLLPVGTVQAGAPSPRGGPSPEAFVPAPSLPDAGDDRDDAPYTLSAAYPNPFRTRTQFDLSVKQTQRVSVEVYNILGRRVRTIYDGVMRTGDARTFTIEARGLPSGLYLYRVRGEHFTAARRVTLVQ